jgi:hypothetical protein
MDPSARLDVGGWIRVGELMWAARVGGCGDQAIGTEARKAAEIVLFRKDESGLHPRVSPDATFDAMMPFAFNPVLIRERPVFVPDLESRPPGPAKEEDWGTPVAAGDLAEKIAAKDKDWAKNILFPWGTCETPNLLFTDLLPMEMIRRHIVAQGGSVAFVGAEPIVDDHRVVREVFPHAVTWHHENTDNKIAELAVVFCDSEESLKNWVDAQGHPWTAALEACGKGIIFLARKDDATEFFGKISRKHLSARLIHENYEESRTRSEIQARRKGKTEAEREGHCVVSYCRGVAGSGVNFLDLTHAVIDCAALRPISSFNPALLDPESFQHARNEERAALVRQVLGRLLRGVKGRVSLVVLVGCPPELEEALRESPSLQAAVEQPVLFRHGDDPLQVAREGAAWLKKGGGPWPVIRAEPKPAKAPGGRPKRSGEDVVKAAEEAIAKGVTWRDFVRKSTPERVLDATELATLKARFTGA